MTRLLSDDDVRARLTPQLALEGARRALVEAHRGGLHAPPRVQAELGAARTGALGAAAVDALALPDADVVGVIGSGRQAWTQLWAATAARGSRRCACSAPQRGTATGSPSGPAPSSAPARRPFRTRARRWRGPGSSSSPPARRRR